MDAHSLVSRGIGIGSQRYAATPAGVIPDLMGHSRLEFRMSPRRPLAAAEDRVIHRMACTGPTPSVPNRFG